MIASHFGEANHLSIISRTLMRTTWNMAESVVQMIVAAPLCRRQPRLGPTKVGFVDASLSKSSPQGTSRRPTLRF